MQFGLMKKEGIDTFVEIGPGKALTGFIKKELGDVCTINIFDVESLESGIEKLLKRESELEKERVLWKIKK